jgi:hypothetical protein
MKFIMLSARFWDNTRLLVMLWRMSPGADGHIKNAMNWANGLDRKLVSLGAGQSSSANAAAQ